MKKSKTFLVCATLSGSVLFSSCIGSFGLWNSLKDWNQGVSNKFVNELIFLAFHIVPVYEIAYLADVLVLNSIEFWSGSNPTASIGEVKQCKEKMANTWLKPTKTVIPLPKRRRQICRFGLQQRKQYMERCFWRTELRTCENERRRDSYFEPAKRNLHDCHS